MFRQITLELDIELDQAIHGNGDAAALNDHDL